MADSDFLSLLTNTVTIKRRTAGTVDDLGVPAETFSTVATGVKCLIQDQKGTYILERKGEEVSVDSIGFFDYGTDIQEDDIIEFGSKKYSVYFIENAGGQDDHYEVGLKQI